MAEKLPDFERPPVIEVALGVQFEPLPLTGTTLGQLALKYGDRYPRIEEKPPLDAVVEQFGVRPRAQTPKFEIRQQPPPVRVWYTNEGLDELVQVQEDRFVFNWRKAGDDTEYPRYSEVAKGFRSAFDLFASFLAERDLPIPTFNQAEVTYVNHIFPAAGVWETHAEADRAVRLIGVTESSFLPPPENIRVAARYLMTGEEETPLGRLHVLMEPRWLKTTDEPLLQLQLTARGGPIEEGFSGVQQFFDVGRVWIVRGFVDVTTPEMHKIWGRR